MVARYRREFSISRRSEEPRERRIHFRRYGTERRLIRRPLWWLLLLTIVVMGLIYYLTRLAAF